jgi:hypothetical protein
LLALAGGLGDGAVHVENGALEERSGLFSPDAEACLVDRVEQRFDIWDGEASTEVARCGGIGNAASIEGVEVIFVVAEAVDVLQTSAAAQGVEGDVENVIGFVIGLMEFEQMQPLIDFLREAEPLRHSMQSADAAIGQGSRFV